jgi:DMSO/TMAO reductase YedYZ molybdopterin-dependent catalytic subunit
VRHNRRVESVSRHSQGALPPGQHLVARAPVIYVGEVPSFDPATWSLLVDGVVEHPLRLAWRDVLALPRVALTADMHGATGWTCRGMEWEGIPLAAITSACNPLDTARFLIARDRDGYSASLALAALSDPGALLALSLGDRPLEPRRGGPLRLVVPERYAWKSVKWLRRLEFSAQDEGGYWESRGAHPNANPWRGERQA